MAKTMAFTQTSVARLAPPKASAARYKDERTAGLYVRVLPSGRKTFEFVKHKGRRWTRLAIGVFPTMTVGQARAEAARLAGLLAQGDHPGEERRRARQEMTFGELFEMYLEGHAKPHKRTWQQDQQQFDRNLTPWQHRPLSDIRRADVAELHAKIGRSRGRYQANRVLALISVVFNYAQGIGCEGANPAKGVKKFKELSRDRFLRADELQRFFAALADNETPQLWRDFFTLALLTGARRSNVQAMRWSDIELERGLWRIPEAESKNAEPLICVLHPAAVDILKRRSETATSEFVFPSRRITGHITQPRKAWAAILERAGIAGVHMHDLRRTLGSWQAATGASLSIIGRALGHKSMTATAVYARLDLDPVRASVLAAGDAMLAAGQQQKALPAPE
ncbi:MAG TPA: tyrosine-type recombinase/integrase [Phycisphaerae bacterium]|nr:tyrosine-type recombinase/integrase [Phycisphaerae bacterium]